MTCLTSLAGDRADFVLGTVCKVAGVGVVCHVGSVCVRVRKSGLLQVKVKECGQDGNEMDRWNYIG